MTAKRALATLTIAAFLAVAGCGDDEPVTIEGDGYSFEAPAGWQEISQEVLQDVAGGEGIAVPPEAIDSGAIDIDTGESVNVTLPGGGALLRSIDEQGAQRLEDRYAGLVEAQLPPGGEIAEDPVVTVSELGGVPAYLATVSVEGNTEDLNHLRQYLTLNEETNYVVTVTAKSPETADGATDEIAGTWTWE